MVYRETVGMPAESHQSEHVELAMKILDRRQRLRRIGWDLEQSERFRAEMKRLERQLRADHSRRDCGPCGRRHHNWCW